MSMKNPEENIVLQKTKAFALRCIKLYKYMVDEKREFVISKQVLRSGTSIGANVKEALRGQSRADFAAKMNIALKEASETEYWLELLFETGYLEENQYKKLNNDCGAIRKMLISSCKTLKEKK